jgi:hypothetical protein
MLSSSLRADVVQADSQLTTMKALAGAYNTHHCTTSVQVVLVIAT